MTTGDAGERVVVHHTVDLPIREAFDAWLDPELIPLWWGPEGYSTRVDTLDARIGGRFRFHMTAPSGDACAMTGTYTRIDRPSALDFEVHDHCVADIPAGIEPPTRTSRVAVRFDVVGARTRIRITQTGLPPAYQVLARAGWGDSLSRFAQATANPDSTREIAEETRP